MHKLTNLAAVLLLSTLLALPSWAAKTEENPPVQPPSQTAEQAAEQAKVDAAANDPHQSDAFKRQQEYMQKREAMRKHRDEALKVREQNTN
jgi:hypothetical protein